jgi:hypothetical protein
LINGSGALPTLVNEDPTNNFFSTFGINWSPSNQIEIVDFGLKGVEKDPITNGFVAEGLSVANNGYLMQSTTITKPEIAFPMINMKENNKNISIRIDKKTSRAIYLGFNLNVLTNQNQREDLVRKSIDWLEGITSIQTQSLEKCNLQVRYLDFGKFLLVNNSNTTLNNTEISLFNLIGHKLVDIFTGDLLIGENLINYNISSLNSEYYFIYIRNNKYNK